MGLFDRFAYSLTAPVGNGLDNKPGDVRNTKRRLHHLDYFDDEVENDFITRELDHSIRDFQRAFDLREDG